jgi:UDP-glucose 6-dehydrogenase
MEVSKAIGMDSEWGPKFLKSSVGWRLLLKRYF